jgi:hypothetical protein
MGEFFNQMAQTNVFTGLSEEYINYIFQKFSSLLPILQQRKQYN